MQKIESNMFSQSPKETYDSMLDESDFIASPRNLKQLYNMKHNLTKQNSENNTSNTQF